MNARLYGNAPRTSTMVFRDIISCIISKVNYIRNMASSITYFILLRDFLMIYSILFYLFIGFLDFEGISF
jgi:NurA-like 5'-3' nuclease